MQEDPRIVKLREEKRALYRQREHGQLRWMHAKTFTAMVEEIDGQIADINAQILARWKHEREVRDGEVTGRARERSTKERQERIEARKLRTFAPTYVYLIRASMGLYKIGRTDHDPVLRLKDLGKFSPCELELVCAIETRNSFELEQQYHQEFADKKIRGEWFALTEEVVACIKERANGK